VEDSKGWQAAVEEEGEGSEDASAAQWLQRRVSVLVKIADN